VLQATSNVSSLKTTLTGLADGNYDLFGFFWADTVNDLRVQFGLETNHMQLYRRNGAQQAEAGQFDAAETLVGGGLNLYRAYLGRVTVSGGSSVSAIIDDFATGTANRAMYDGLGYALVSLTGDYDHDGTVDAADYVVWSKTLGQTGAGLAADGNGNGMIDNGDFDVWRTNFGQTSGSGSGASANRAVPEPTTVLQLVLVAAAVSTRRRRGCLANVKTRRCVTSINKPPS
jgi:hypothetical protein